jgi:CubicO group peptidase (beta-lactamase class C family)
MAKSFTSTLLGIALGEGAISSLDDPITKYIPELLKRDERFANINIKDLLMMSSGIRYNEDAPDNDNDITYLSLNLRRSALENTVIIDPPGRYFLYNNYHPLLIGMILERATGRSVTHYLQEKLWDPLDMEFSGSWSTDSKEDAFEKMESGINTRSIDFAKLGRLFLNYGRWNGKQIVSEHWVEEATQPEEKPSSYYEDDPWFVSNGRYYKYFWWGAKRPGGRNDFAAIGNKGQYIYISPQKNLIIVRNGIDYGISSDVWLRLFYEFASII